MLPRAVYVEVNYTPMLTQRRMWTVAEHTKLNFCSFCLHCTGITSGHVFCGCVGSVGRYEYAMVGDRVNTSARLMAAVPGKDGLLCDMGRCRKNVYPGCVWAACL